MLKKSTLELIKLTLLQVIFIVSILPLYIEIFDILLISDYDLIKIDLIQNENELTIAIDGIIHLYKFFHNSIIFMIYMFTSLLIMNHYIHYKINTNTYFYIYNFFKKSIKYLILLPLIVFFIKSLIYKNDIRLVLYIILNLYIVIIIKKLI